MQSIENLTLLTSQSDKISYKLCDFVPAWRVITIDNQIGLLRIYKGNRKPYQSPMLKLRNGPFIEGLSRYNLNLWQIC